MGVVAYGVALAGLRLEREPGIELLEPARLTWREDHVREQPARAGLAVELLARLRHLLVGEEPVPLDVRWRRRDERDLGVAVEEHLLDVVAVFEVLEGLLLV